MKHPTKEELVSFLYNETSSEKKSELKAHLESCAECRAQLSDWQSVKADLNAWKLSASVPRPFISRHAFKWAAAAVFMIALGFALGRLNPPTGNTEQMRGQIQAELQKSFQQQMKAAQETQRKEFIAMLRDIEVQRLAEYTELRKDLETVAVIADEKLTTTERALNRLNLVAQSESLNQPTK